MIKRQLKHIVWVVIKILETKNQVSKKLNEMDLNKIDQCFYQNLVAGKNKFLLKTKNSIKQQILKWIKALKNFLLNRDKLHFRQPGDTYSACGPFTNYHERIQKFTETDNLKHWYRNELDETCFAHDAAYSDSRDK